MDRRFVRVWETIESRTQAGEPMQKILVSLSADELVAALAAAGAQSPVHANVIATELLNRLKRAPFLGVTIATSTLFVALFVLDALFTEAPLLALAGGPRDYLLAALIALSALASLLMFLAWRGRIRLPPGRRARTRRF